MKRKHRQPTRNELFDARMRAAGPEGEEINRITEAVLAELVKEGKVRIVGQDEHGDTIYETVETSLQRMKRAIGLR